MQNSPSCCPACGQTIPPDAPFGLCACGLLAEALSAVGSGAIPEEKRERIGPYRLLGRLGEGGFGVVYRARQEWPVQRQAAIKVLKPGIDSVQVSARFQAERQTLARMDHPHVATIFDAGETEDGLPFFVMEHVEGTDLKTFCREQALDIPARLELFMAICKGVHHAHQKGIIHRDLKPANLLVALEDGRPSPKVIDFGIAKALAPATGGPGKGLTRGQQVLGTVAYMSPEQAAGSPDIDARSDIYSLGAVLYELLTGSPPHGGRSFRRTPFQDALRIIRETDPPAPSARAAHRRAGNLAVPPSGGPPLERLLRGDLDSIVMRAMERDPFHRYETAQALVEDIERHLRHEPVMAAHPGRLYCARKFAEKHRRLVFASAAVGITLVSVFSVTGLMLVRTVSAQADERIARRAVEAGILQHEVAQQTLDGLLLDSLDELVEGLAASEDLAVLLPLAHRAFRHHGGRELTSTPDTVRFFFNLGMIFQEGGDLKEARDAFDRTLELLEQSPEHLAAASLEARITEARCLLHRSSVSHQLNAKAAAHVDLERAVSLLGPLAVSNREARRLLAELRGLASELHEKAGRLDLAVEEARHEVDVLAVMNEAATGHGASSLGEARLRLAGLLRDQGDRVAAGACLEAAAADLEATAPDRVRNRALARVLTAQGDLFRDELRTGEARERYSAAADLLMAALEPDRELLLVRVALLRTRKSLAEEENRLEEAENHQLGLVNAYAELLRQARPEPRWTREIIRAYIELCWLKAQLKRPFLHCWDHGDKLLRDARSITPEDEEWDALDRELSRLKALWRTGHVAGL